MGYVYIELLMQVVAAEVGHSSWGGSQEFTQCVNMYYVSTKGYYNLSYDFCSFSIIHFNVMVLRDVELAL